MGLLERSLFSPPLPQGCARHLRVKDQGLWWKLKQLLKMLSCIVFIITFYLQHLSCSQLV